MSATTLCASLSTFPKILTFQSIKSHPHLVPDILQQFISMCVEGAGTERRVPAVLLEPAGQVHPASLVQVQLLLGDQVRAIHPWVDVDRPSHIEANSQEDEGARLLYRVFFPTGPPPKSSKYRKVHVRCI